MLYLLTYEIFQFDILWAKFSSLHLSFLVLRETTRATKDNAIAYPSGDWWINYRKPFTRKINVGYGENNYRSTFWH